MPKLTLVFNENNNGDYCTPLGDHVFFRSPFIEYVAKSPEYQDLFEFRLLGDIAEEEDKEDEICILALGIDMGFDLSLASYALNDSEALQPIKSLLSKLKSAKKTIYLLLDMSWECGFRRHIEIIPFLAQKLRFPVRRLIYLSNNSATAMLSTLPSRFGFVAMGTWFFDFYMHVLHRDVLDQVAALAQNRHPDRYFLSLNRRVRSHRLLLVAYLAAKRYLPESFVSFAGRTAAEVDNTYLRGEAIDYAREMAAAIPEFRGEGNSYIDYVLENEPLEIDVNFSSIPQDSPIFNKTALSTSPDIAECYNRSYVSIITETDFGGSNFENLLTEKTFKPILFGHPFILISGPGALAELRRLGYRTYSPIIDEGYDEINDPAQRFAAIANTIDKAVACIQSDPNAFQRETADIIAANQKNFIEGSPQRIRKFVSDLIFEIRRTQRCGFRASPLTAHTSYRFSRFPNIEFGPGFYEFEVSFNGRWCSAAGTLTFWLSDGDWKLTIYIRGNDPVILPDVYQNGDRLPYTQVIKEDRIGMEFFFKDFSQFTTLQFCAKSMFIPAHVTSESKDQRRLSFWLCDEFELENEFLKLN
jgi:hypothetical protein